MNKYRKIYLLIVITFVLAILACGGGRGGRGSYEATKRAYEAQAYEATAEYGRQELEAQLTEMAKP